MFRATTSIVLALAIVIALSANVCFGCASMQRKTAKTSCCNHSDRCKSPKRAPAHEDCATSPIQTNKVERPAASLLDVLDPVFELTQYAAANSPAPAQDVTESLVHSQDAPDLCLRNSVLLI